MSGEDGKSADLAPALFKKKKGARQAASSSSTLSTAPKRDIQKHADSDEDAEPSIVVRSRGVRGRGPGADGGRKDVDPTDPMSVSSKQRPRPKSGLSFGAQDEELEGNPTKQQNEASFTLRKSALARSAYDSHQETEKSTDTLPYSLQKHASIGESAYSPAALAELKASTPGKRVSDDDEQASFYQTVSDPTMQVDEETGESLARMKFGADFAHDAIPSEALIAAAKERRKRAAENGTSAGDDFVSLTDYSQGPHPESRLQREEDDLGSGEEDFAQYTGATERLELSRSAREKAQEREKSRRREAMELEDGEDDSEKEWEEAQLRRIQGAQVDRRKQQQARQPSPFRAAQIPKTAPLPSISGTSIRLQQRIHDIQATIDAQDVLESEAVKQLQQLHGDEKRNKHDTEAAADKEAWFRELHTFIHSMALFLEEKAPLLQDIEADWTGHLAERVKLIQTARATALMDDLALFHGVVSRNVLPWMQNKLPNEDGDALSETRVIRRQERSSAPTEVLDELKADDAAAFDRARNDIVRRLEDLFRQVQAPEFREPAARIEKEAGQHATLHPSSLVARFHRWRRLYPEEYSNAWGGLTLASVWDFWIRKEMCGWDMLRLHEQRPGSLDEFVWYIELAHYGQRSTLASHNTQNGDASQNAPLGGDDEVIQHACTNTVLPMLTKQIELGVFDPWQPRHNTSTIELAEQLSYILEKDDARFQSFILSILQCYQSHIQSFAHALQSPPSSPAPPLSPERPLAMQRVLQITHGLVLQLVAWHRFVTLAQRPFYKEVVSAAVQTVLFPLWEQAITLDAVVFTVQNAARDVLQRCDRPALLDVAMQTRLQGFAERTS